MSWPISINPSATAFLTGVFRNVGTPDPYPSGSGGGGLRKCATGWTIAQEPAEWLRTTLLALSKFTFTWAFPQVKVLTWYSWFFLLLWIHAHTHKASCFVLSFRTIILSLISYFYGIIILPSLASISLLQKLQYRYTGVYICTLYSLCLFN